MTNAANPTPRTILVKSAHLVRSLRELRGLSDEALAAASGVSASRIRRIEAADSAHLTLETLARITSALGYRLELGVEPFSSRARPTKREAVRRALRNERSRLERLENEIDAIPDDIIERACACFEDVQAAAEWLTQPSHQALGGLSIIEAVNAPEGPKSIRHLLGAIEHGVFL